MPEARRPRFVALLPNGEWVLLVIIAAELAVFGLRADHFLTGANAFEVVRLAAETGLLALGLTPVIKAGGIDLSVGSMMGLSAVVLGAGWSALGLPLPLAVGAALLTGAAGGALHGHLVTRRGVPPLIVTLATFSLYRGLAEAVTGGYVSYSGFPGAFLWLGQGYLGGIVPAQLPVLAVAAAALWLMLHRATLGREITAIGFSPEGARHAGIRVDRVLMRAYVVCGLCASLAGTLYVARVGQAKADAGLGSELTAIAAVVLGGTAITGGRGTILGSLLGLLTLVILGDGLRLAGQPGEIAGLCSGLVLLASMVLGRLWSDGGRRGRSAAIAGSAVLAAAVLAAAAALSRGAAPASARMVVAVTPKTVTDPYFVTCREGAEEAARELGVDLLWDGPQYADPASQNEIVDGWITKKVDVVAASLVNPKAISSVLRKAEARGIRVVTWDSDAEPDARDFFVNQATSQGIGSALADEGSRLAGGSGQYAIITASLTDTNQNEWIRGIEDRMAAAHPGMTLATVHPCDGQRDKAMTEARNIVRAYPGVKVLIAICSPAVPGAAEALKQEDNRRVRLTGLSTPNLCRGYVHEGWVQSIVLWNTRDLGYLTVYAAKAVREGSLRAGAVRFKAGRLGTLSVEGSQVLLGKPFVFDSSNIDRFHF
jgi:rhamnose transport system substrate-binding protein